MSNSKNNSPNIRRKLALVIGNQNYVKRPLRHSENDANDLHAVLTEIGFTVDRELNCKYDKMNDAIEKFSKKIKDEDLLLFYFAGHGFQYEGQNYLVSIDAIQDSDEILIDQSKLIKVDNILEKLSKPTFHVSIFLLDCCQENLSASKIIHLQDVETRDISEKKTESQCGIKISIVLVKMTAPGGSIIQFACAPGYRAADGYDQERNGLYTKYLLKHIARPKVEINLIFRRITRDVFEESKAKQKPYIKGDLMTEEPIYLSAGDSNDAMPFEAIRRKYQQYYVERFMNTCQKVPIEECYINLSITRTEEQEEKEKKLQSAKSHDEIINTYEEIYRNTTSIDIKEIFDKCKDRKKQVRVIGRAGIGKSIFCRYVAYQWAEGKLWSHYELVVLITLNSLTHESYPMSASDVKYSLVDLVQTQYFPCESLSDDDKMYFKSLCDEGKVLWLLDGYDELSLNISHQLKSVFDTIYQTQHHILTTRPYDISLSYKTQVEIIGFTDANITMYVNQFFEQLDENESESQHLLTYLKSNTKIWGIAHIPVHLELICCIWSDRKISMTKEASAKTTLEVTMLYDEMVQWLCRQYLKKQKHMATCSMTRNALRKHCEKELEFLENVAFYVMKDSSVIIDSNVFVEVEKTMGWFISDYPQLLNIGILKSFNDQRIGSHVDVKKPHYFVHLSFQEFFAAGYIVTGLRSGRPEDSINFIKANKYDQRFRLLLNFVSGLLTLYNEKEPIQYFWDAILNEPLDLVGLRHFDLIISCLEETRGGSSIPRRQELVDYIVMWIKIGVNMEDNKVLTYLQQALQQSCIIANEITIQETLIQLMQSKEPSTKINTLTLLSTLPFSNFPEKLLMEDNKVLTYLQQALQQSCIIANEISIQETLIQLMQSKEPSTKINTLTLLSTLPFSNFPEKLLDLIIIDLNIEPFYFHDTISKALTKLLEHIPHDVVLQRLLTVLKPQHNSKLIERVFTILKNTPENHAIYATIHMVVLATQDKNIYHRQIAHQVLGHLGGKATTQELIRLLLTVLSDQDCDVRLCACNALGLLGEKAASEEVVKVLSAALSGQDNGVRVYARRALERLVKNTGSEKVTKGLLTALSDQDCDVRECACDALGRLGEKAASEEVIKGLLIALSDQDYRVKKRACDALRQLGEKAASEEMIRGLLIALNDRDSVVRVYACKALIQIDGKRGDVHIMNALVDLFLRSDSECYHFLSNHLKNALYHSETMIILKSDIVRKLEISLSKRCFEEFLAMPTHKFVNALLKTVDVSWMPIVIRAALYQRNAIVVWDNFIWIYGSEEPKRFQCTDKMKNQLVEAFSGQGKKPRGATFLFKIKNFFLNEKLN
ncbi:unnamed protein product [Rotaria socialis]|uniref:NACHT domain-containing protein n=1 Tax=Rotaria socialis TaxID=392032 RepID=A0A818PD49_9BILA|nr:unnamed protein product [Rotaria socialis]